MVEVVGVRFREAGHIYYFAPGKSEYIYNEKVLVESQQSKQLATVAIPKKTVDSDDLPEDLKPILNKATANDLEKEQKNLADAEAAKSIANEKIRAHDLKMKLVRVEYTFDRSKMIFYFTADGRIDFRELVKDLAAIFRTRIELRQIGVRDEAKILGGIGPCGRQLCCSTFLGDFMPVSIKMAKDQGLSLNPVKISGLCGRLMCCLKYENDEYEAAKKELPDYGKEVITPDGKGKVVGLNLLSRIMITKKSKKLLRKLLLKKVIKMDKRSLYDGLNSLETDLDSSVTQLREIKAALHELVEKNTTLEIENQRLREHLQELNKLAGNTTETEKQELSKSRMNLEKLYEEGFHVCNILYGSRRENDEECAFCLDVIYGERTR